MAAAKTKKAAADKAKKTRKTSTRKTAASKKSAGSSPDSENVATVDRRASKDRRKASDRRQKDVPVAVERRKTERRAKVNRRRQIDPTTCERDYSADELEFMNALDDYKRASGRMFPTCSEVLEVLKKLGYEKRPADESVEPTTPATERQSGDAGPPLPQQQDAIV